MVTGVTLGFDLQPSPPQAPLTERHYLPPCNRNQQSVSIMGLNPGAHEELPELKELSGWSPRSQGFLFNCFGGGPRQYLFLLFKINFK